MRPASPAFLKTAGLFGLVAGLLGPPIAALMLLWPAQIAKGPMCYPFTPTGFAVAQVGFFLHHIGLLVLLVGFARSGAFGPGRVVGWAAWLAVAGMTLLTLAELNSIRFAELDAAVANAGSVGAVYGIACNAVGLGLLVSGVGVLRARVWSGWRRFMPLVIGIATFVELTPGMFGGFVIARFAIALWILLFAGLGRCLR